MTAASTTSTTGRVDLARLNRRGLAAAVGLIVLLVAFLAAPSPASAASAPVVGGEVQWGVKASFVAYVTGPVGQGTATTNGGATGSFTFPNANGTLDSEGSAFDVAVSGGVHFVAHAGALDLSIANLRVSRSGGSGHLVADVSSKDLNTGVVGVWPGLALATLDFTGAVVVPSGSTTTWSGVASTLTAAGSEAFSGFYQAGTALDPLTVVLTAEADEEEPREPEQPTTTTSTAPTSTTTPSTSTPSTSAPSSTVPGSVTTVPGGTTVPVPTPTPTPGSQGPSTGTGTGGARAALPRTGASGTAAMAGAILALAGVTLVAAGRRARTRAA